MKRIAPHLEWISLAALLILVVLGFGTWTAYAAGTLVPAGDVFEVAAPSVGQAITDSNAIYHDAAVAEDGSITAVWVLQKEGVSTGVSSYNTENPFPFPVYARRFQTDGTPLTAVIEVSVTSLGSMNRNVRPRVASDASGNFVVCWLQRQDNGLGRSFIYARMFGAGGTPQGEEFVVTEDDAASIPTVAMNGDGRFVVAWEDDSTDNILVKRYAADGVALDNTPIEVNQTNDKKFTAGGPSVAMNADGQFVIGWCEQRNFTFINSWRYQWLVQPFNADGRPRSTAKVVETRYNTLAISGFSFIAKRLGESSTPAVGINPNGEYAISWIPNIREIGPKFQFFRASGMTQGSAVLATETIKTDYSRQLAAAMDDDGDFTMIWKGYDEDCEGRGIFLRQVSNDQSDPGAELLVAGCKGSGANEVSAPAMDTNTDGDIVVIWCDTQQLYGVVYHKQ